MDKRGADQREKDLDNRDLANKAVTDQAIRMLEDVQDQMLVEVGHVREAIRILRDGRPSIEGDSDESSTA